MPAERNVECLIIGANGLIGRRISKVLTSKVIKWEGTYSKRPEDRLLKLDITNPQEVKEVILKFLPEVIFHCANLAGGVDFCQSNPKVASDFHLNATIDIGSFCKDIGAKLVFISTDYVFDGLKGTPYNEEDLPRPLNLQGRLKFQAEQWIQKNLEKYLIIRTTNVYGWDLFTITPNYIMNLYRTLKNKDFFSAPSFLWGNPTYVGDFAQAVVELYIKKANGIFHVVGSEFINRFEWAREACMILGLDCSLINELEQPQAYSAPRPLRPCLNTDKFTKAYKTVLHDVSTGLALMKSEMD